MHEIFTQIFPQFLWPLGALHLHDFTTVAGLCFLSSIACNRSNPGHSQYFSLSHPHVQSHHCMFSTSCVNAGVPVLLVVQFPRHGTGSFPNHLINTKREKCYTRERVSHLDLEGAIEGCEEEDASKGYRHEVEVDQTHNEKCKT